MARVEPHESFGANLRAHRKRLGLSQEALGFKCDLRGRATSPQMSTMIARWGDETVAGGPLY
jgi:hypothetical protein